MDPVGKALWYIETHFAEDIALDDVAAVAGVSRFHLARMFGVATGHSVMRYVRNRRLSGAARALAGGAPDILSVALDAGYGSHEAFTRAFRDRFGVTPETVRARRSTHDLKLLEPMTMNSDPVTLPPPRFVDRGAFLVAGLKRHFTYEERPGIPALWQRFIPYTGHIPGEIHHINYGVMYSGDESSFHYMACSEVRTFDGVPPELDRMRLEQQRYAVFPHQGHVSDFSSTIGAVWRQWLPQSGLTAVEAPMFEYYGPRFDPGTGTGDMEVWVPVTG